MLGLTSLAKRLFGSSNDRILKPYYAKVPRINALEPEFVKLTDEQLRQKTFEFREQVAKGRKLDDLMFEAFATVREAAKRTLGQRHFDVQLIGGMVLHDGNISEMRTGEGKTLVATAAGLPQRPVRQGRPRRHRQRLPRPPRRRMDGSGLSLPRPHRRLHRPRPERRAAPRPPTPATSPTAPTTSSASTTCATT
jgi:hypothetical protein